MADNDPRDIPRAHGGRDPNLDLDGATELEIVLDELPPGERMVDATV